jgi:magnesium transporter
VSDAATGIMRCGVMNADLVAVTVALSLIGVVTFGTLAGAMLPFLMRRLGFDPASASAPFIATFVDVTGLIIYFNVALHLLLR